jgi:hypothetical protein
LTFQRQNLIIRIVVPRLSKWLVVLTLTLSIGTHWAFLQSVAWAGMIFSYSHDGSLTQAISKTFDGRHPCCLCKLVRQGKATEKRQEAQRVEIKLDQFLPVGPAFVLTPPTFWLPFFRVLDQSVSRVEAPPTPPPRSLPV